MDRANFLDQLRIFGGCQRLRAIRKSKFWMVVDFDHETIRSHRYSGASQRCDHVGGTSTMGRIYDYREMGNSTNCWYGREIERITSVLRESADTSLAQDDVVIALGHDVFGGEQPFLECSC